MPLETGDFIPELDPNNPLGSENVSLGDDHIRLLKRCTTGSFPAFVGTTAVPKSVTLTEDQINDAALKAATDNVFTGPVQIGLGTPSNLRTLTVLGTATAMGLFETNSANGGTVDVNATQVAPVGGVGIRSQVAGTAKSFSGWREDLVQWVVSNSGTGSTWFGADSTGLKLPNNSSLFGRDFANANWANLIKVNLNDVLDIGDNSLNMRRLALLTDDQFINGGLVATWRTSGLQLQNTKLISSRNAADNADMSMLFANASDQVLLGSTSGDQTLLFLDSPVATTIRLRLGGIESARIDSNAAGSLLVSDRTGTRKKAGFRNPSALTVGSGRALTQDDEGKVFYISINNVQLTQFQMEAGTVLRLVTLAAATSDVRLIEGASGVTQIIDQGGSQFTGDFQIAPSSVVELHWRTSTECHVFGNGISPHP